LSRDRPRFGEKDARRVAKASQFENGTFVVCFTTFVALRFCIPATYCLAAWLRQRLPQKSLAGEYFMTEMVSGFWGNDEGQHLVEYALLVLLVGVALIAAMDLLTGGISSAFSEGVSAL